MYKKLTKQQIEEQVDAQESIIKQWIELFKAQIERLAVLDIMEGKQIKLYHGYKDDGTKHQEKATKPEQILQIHIVRRKLTGLNLFVSYLN